MYPVYYAKDYACVCLWEGGVDAISFGYMKETIFQRRRGQMNDCVYVSQHYVDTALSKAKSLNSFDYNFYVWKFLSAERFHYIGCEFKSIYFIWPIYQQRRACGYIV